MALFRRLHKATITWETVNEMNWDNNDVAVKVIKDSLVRWREIFRAKFNLKLAKSYICHI